MFLIQLRREFQSIVSLDDRATSFLEKWPHWSEKLLKVAKLESSSCPVLQKLLDTLAASNNEG